MYALSRRFVAILAAGLMFATASLAAAQEAKNANSPAAPELKLPPGWTMEDMQACILAGTPGKMHERLAEGVGTWEGKQTMWMAPGTEPITSTIKSTCSKLLDGRFVKVEVQGNIPGMGPYNGMGIYGFDNVAQQFVTIWIDNHGTGMMNGTGKLSANGKTLTTNYIYNCPILKKPTTMRDIETITGSNTKTIEMFGIDPKSGKEFKMMVLELVKK